MFVHGYRNRSQEHIPDYPKKRRICVGAALEWIMRRELGDGGCVSDIDWATKVTTTTTFGHCTDVTTFEGTEKEMAPIFETLKNCKGQKHLPSKVYDITCDSLGITPDERATLEPLDRDTQWAVLGLRTENPSLPIEDLL